MGGPRCGRPVPMPQPSPRDPQVLPVAVAEGMGVPFHSTQWSVVIEARAGSHDREAALATLCRSYWLPVYGYLRRRGHSPADAEDLTQDFFVFLLESDFLDRPDPCKGRFRGYLVGVLRHFVSGQRERARAQKRGGTASFIDWDTINAEGEFAALEGGVEADDPARTFERGWALSVLANALKQLEAEQREAGRGRAFEVLKPYLSAAPSPGEYDRAAAVLLTTRTTVALWVHRLNHRYAELVKLAVAATVRNPADLRDELQHLVQALRG